MRRTIIVLLLLMFSSVFSDAPKMPLDVVIFVSSECPSCKKAAVMFYEMSNSAYKGKMSVTIKPLYRQVGDIALIAAAQQNKTRELITVYANTSSRIDAKNIIGLFNEAGIDTNKIYEDMQDSTKILSILNANYAEARNKGMNFTPHILINDKVYDGELSPTDITEYINALLK